MWAPTPERAAASRMADFIAWVGRRHDRDLTSYRDALRWSVDELSEFWDSIREYFDVLGDGFAGPALAEERMPGAVWYPTAKLNYAENILRFGNDTGQRDRTAIVDLGEDGSRNDITWGELRNQVASLAAGLRARGVAPGDRVVAVLPNIPEAIIGLLAVASLGAVWSICSPDLSPKAILDRLGQLEPVALIGTEGYVFKGRWLDLTEHLGAIEAGLPSLRCRIVVGVNHNAGRESYDNVLVAEAVARYEPVPFDHNLWILFTSGTTGPPKGIVHGHGGMILEHLKTFGLHFDLSHMDRYYVAANTSWMVWNTLLGSLMVGASIITYSGSPTYPHPDRLFEIVAHHSVTTFGAGAAYLALVRSAGASPRENWDLRALHTLMSTGSNLPDAIYRWVHDDVGAEIHLAEVSGGTDICSGFLGCNPLEPVLVGRLQGPMLGVAVEVRDAKGSPIVGQLGEMVITRPMPSMPTSFWGDDDGSRYRSAYFEQFPGVWTHGDWILEGTDGTFEVRGRSDATLNRAGVRLGSAEIYSAIQTIDGITDALVLGIELPQGKYYMPLYVTLAEDVELDDSLRSAINHAIRTLASARHVPDEVLLAPAIPTTHAGKRPEIPIKRLFTGGDPAKFERGALANPESLDWFIDEARRFLDTHTSDD
jgi:acetoacetyl-CoA synthetase